MKKTACFVCLLLLSVAMTSPAPAAADEQSLATGKAISLGGEVTLNSPTTVDEILADPEKYHNTVVLVTGEISDVCKGSGCWISLKTDGGEPFYCKSENDAVIFPRDCTGRQAMVQGTVKVSYPEGAYSRIVETHPSLGGAHGHSDDDHADHAHDDTAHAGHDHTGEPDEHAEHDHTHAETAHAGHDHTGTVQTHAGEEEPHVCPAPQVRVVVDAVQLR